MAVSNQINRVQFIAEDFDTYRAEADAFYAANYPDAFNNLINTDLGNALMDQLAFAMQSLSFMVNRRASELYLSTAKLNKSITKLVRMLGYPISPGSPGSTDLFVSLTNGPYPFPITIQSGFQFQGPGDIIYEFRQDTPYVFPANAVSGSFPVREGVTRVATYISSGEVNQEFRIAGIPEGYFLYADGMVVTVDGVEWDRTSLMPYESSNLYEILFTEEPPKLRFGDGIAGNVPPSGSQIVLKYVIGKGLQGSIGSNQLSAPVVPLAVNGQTIAMSLTNTVGVVGSDPEDIRHVQAFASSFFRTQNAAVIKSDYDTIAQLQSGVAIADAQIMRGVSGDLTIQSYFDLIRAGQAYFDQAAQLLSGSNVSGISGLSVSGIGGLAVSGIGSLNVANTNLLGVSGISHLGWNGSSVTGTQFLGVSGISSLAVGNTVALYVSGIPGLGVMGISGLGVANQDQIDALVTSASGSFGTAVSGLYDYLSNAFSDTSKANQVQIVVLSVDANNKYIAPSQTVLDTVEDVVQNLADAVVTVKAVDGSPNIVEAGVLIEIGISPTAVESDVIQQIISALTQSTFPYGLMVRRAVGRNLYLSDINDAIRAGTSASDVIFMNPIIQSPTELLDGDGNLIISKQQVIQQSYVEVKVVKRFKRGEVYS